MIRVFVLIISFLYPSENIISKKYDDIFEARIKQANSNKNKSIYSVIKPIKVYARQATNNKNDVSLDATSYGLSFNQDIFTSGNIWRGISVANINYEYEHSNIKTDKRNLNYNAYSLVLELRKINLDILKQEKLLENSKITKNIKQESYLKGIVDISELDNALISVNNRDNIINDLKLNKENILSKFSNISNKNYETINIPNLKLPSLSDFMKSNNIDNKKNTISMLNKNISVTKAKYLPKVSVNAQYNYTDDVPFNTSYSVALEASMKVDIFSTYSDIEQSKIKMLLAKLNYSQLQKEENTFYMKSMRQIKIYDSKIELSKQSSHKYNTLVKKIKDLYKHGIRTKEDVTVILNNKKIKDIDSDIFKLKRRISIMDMYKHFKVLEEK